MGGCRGYGHRIINFSMRPAFYMMSFTILVVRKKIVLRPMHVYLRTWYVIVRRIMDGEKYTRRLGSSACRIFITSLYGCLDDRSSIIGLKLVYL
nr:MAG TPA: hypothetical protein [Caudoviricetes sp.]